MVRIPLSREFVFFFKYLIFLILFSFSPTLCLRSHVWRAPWMLKSWETVSCLSVRTLNMSCRTEGIEVNISHLAACRKRDLSGSKQGNEAPLLLLGVKDVKGSLCFLSSSRMEETFQSITCLGRACCAISTHASSTASPALFTFIYTYRRSE